MNLVQFGIPTIFKRDGKTLAVPSMVASTIMVMVLVSMFPSMTPLWMANATRSSV